ncbi:hypothetical protein ACQP25_33480 [Microtetraspora malaysiensis]
MNAVRELFVDALTPEQVAAAGELAAALRSHLAQSNDGSVTSPGTTVT